MALSDGSTTATLGSRPLLPSLFRSDGRVPLRHLKEALLDAVRASVESSLRDGRRNEWSLVPTLPLLVHTYRAAKLVSHSVDTNDRAFITLTGRLSAMQDCAAPGCMPIWGAILSACPGFLKVHPQGPAFRGWQELAGRFPGDGASLPTELIDQLLDALDNSLYPVWSALEACDTSLSEQVLALYEAYGRWPADVRQHYQAVSGALALLRRAVDQPGLRMYVLPSKIISLFSTRCNDRELHQKLINDVFYISNANRTCDERITTPSATREFLTAIEDTSTAMYQQKLAVQAHNPSPALRPPRTPPFAPSGSARVRLVPDGGGGIRMVWGSEDDYGDEAWGEEDDQSALVAALQGASITRPPGAASPRPVSVCYLCSKSGCSSRNPACPLHKEFATISAPSASHSDKAAAFAAMSAFHRAQAPAKTSGSVRQLRWDTPLDHVLGEDEQQVCPVSFSSEPMGERESAGEREHAAEQEAVGEAVVADPDAGPVHAVTRSGAAPGEPIDLGLLGRTVVGQLRPGGADEQGVICQIVRALSADSSPSPTYDYAQVFLPHAPAVVCTLPWARVPDFLSTGSPLSVPDPLPERFLPQVADLPLTRAEKSKLKKSWLLLGAPAADVTPSAAPASAAPPSPADQPTAPLPQSPNPQDRGGRPLPLGMPQRPFGSLEDLAVDPAAPPSLSALLPLLRQSFADLRSDVAQRLKSAESALVAILARLPDGVVDAPANAAASVLAVARVAPGPTIHPGAISFAAGPFTFSVPLSTRVLFDCGAGNTANVSSTLMLTVASTTPEFAALVGTSAPFSAFLQQWTGGGGGFKDANGHPLPARAAALTVTFQGTRGDSPATLSLENTAVHAIGDPRPVILVGTALLPLWSLDSTTNPMKLSFGATPSGLPDASLPWFCPTMVASLSPAPRSVGDPVHPLDTPTLLSILDGAVARQVDALQRQGDDDGDDDDDSWRVVRRKSSPPVPSSSPTLPIPSPPPPDPPLAALPPCPPRTAGGGKPQPPLVFHNTRSAARERAIDPKHAAEPAVVDSSNLFHVYHEWEEAPSDTPDQPSILSITSSPPPALAQHPPEADSQGKAPSAEPAVAAPLA